MQGCAEAALVVAVVHAALRVGALRPLAGPESLVVGTPDASADGDAAMRSRETRISRRRELCSGSSRPTASARRCAWRLGRRRRERTTRRRSARASARRW